MQVFIQASQFFMSLSILVIIHELGHYVFARMFGIRVERFYLFFNPWFSLYKFRRGETEYGVGWLPLGGYVKLSGMIDESMDTDQMKKPPQDHEFRSKPAWQRLLVMTGGVLFNILLAAFIYVFMLYFIGEEYIPFKNMKYGIVAEPLAQDIGLQTGDRILAMNGQEPKDERSFYQALLMGEVNEITVQRHDSILRLGVPADFYGRLISARGEEFMSIRFPFIVTGFVDGSAARKAGVEVGDHIKGIGEEDTWSFAEFQKTIGRYAGQETTITVDRHGETLSMPISIPPEGVVGAYVKSPFEILETERHEYSLFASFPAGINRAVTTTRDYFRSLGLLFRPEVSARDSLGGFITIGSIYSTSWDWVHFWTITAFISIILAVMNILPIPALDGGHVMFLVYEIVVGRKPPDKFMEYAQMVGLILLFSLILLVNINDVLRLFR